MKDSSVFSSLKENEINVLDFRSSKSSLDDFAECNVELYKQNQPFPHIVIDNLFPVDLLRDILIDLSSLKEYQHTKNFFGSIEKYAADEIELFSTTTKRFLNDLNTKYMLSFLERLTSIEGLISDPYYYGGGYHEIRRGGYLKMHTDFNFHQKLKLDRRLNMLIYLNEDWQSDWRGELILSSPDFKKQKSIMPLFNRTVIFSTSDYSCHGHPNPLMSPDHVRRKSLALYYYSNGRPDEETISGKRIDTQYIERPGEKFLPQ